MESLLMTMEILKHIYPMRGRGMLREIWCKNRHTHNPIVLKKMPKLLIQICVCKYDIYAMASFAYNYQNALRCNLCYADLCHAQAILDKEKNTENNSMPQSILVIVVK